VHFYVFLTLSRVAPANATINEDVVMMMMMMRVDALFLHKSIESGTLNE